MEELVIIRHNTRIGQNVLDQTEKYSFEIN